MKRMTTGVLTLAMACTALLSACTPIPVKELAQSDSEKIKSIAVLQVAEPKQMTVANFGGGAAAFGLIGGLIQGSVNESHSKAYTQRVADGGINFAPLIAEGITQSLTSAGYRVIDLHNQKPKLAADGKSDDYSAISTDADGILNVWFGALGYVSPMNTTDFIPWVVVRARLLDGKTKQELYTKTFSCGWDAKNKEVHVDGGASSRFASFDALNAGFDQSISGIKTCESSIVKQISKDLRHAPSGA